LSWRANLPEPAFWTQRRVDFADILSWTIWLRVGLFSTVATNTGGLASAVQWGWDRCRIFLDRRA